LKDHDDDVFTQIYKMIRITWSGKLGQHARSIRSDPQELEEYYENKLLKCLSTFDGSRDFWNYYHSSITRARCDLYRKTKSRLDKEMLESDINRNDSSGQSTFELIITNIPHDGTLEKIRSQRQLIAHLMSKSKDSRVSIIVNAVLSDDNPKLCPTAIEQATGIKRDTVMRCLKKLAKEFDRDLFGDWHDYLTC
jgi:DNA-directed RNA polymerase specialized sigma24 family protein